MYNDFEFLYDLFNGLNPPCILVDREEPFVVLLFETDFMHSIIVIIEIAFITVLYKLFL